MPFHGAAMLRYGFITLFSTLGLWFPSAGMGQGLSLEKLEALSQGALPEIREYITRRLGCSHWEDTQYAVRHRSAPIKRAIRHLRCDSLAEDEAFLRKVYAQHEPSIRALDSVNGLQISASAEPVRQTPPAGGF